VCTLYKLPRLQDKQLIKTDLRERGRNFGDDTNGMVSKGAGEKCVFYC